MNIKNGRYEENGDIIYYKNNKIHRDDDLPAIIQKDGSLQWWINGYPHRENNPAEIRIDGTKYWYNHGQKHRIGGPAVERSDGTKVWRQYNELHRLDGPAYESLDYKSWYKKGKQHRLDGPAVEHVDGKKEWWIEGKEYSEEEFNHIIEKRNLNKRLNVSLEIKQKGKRKKI